MFWLGNLGRSSATRRWGGLRRPSVERRSQLDRQVLFEQSDPTALDCAEHLQFPFEQLRDFTEDGHGEHARASVSVTWTGNLGSGNSGYCDYSRNYEIGADGKAVIHGSADPAFRGDGACW